MSGGQSRAKKRTRGRKKKTDGIKWPTRGQWTSRSREKDVGGRWNVSHRWRRSAYVTCLVFVPCSKFLQKASADNCSIQECFVLVACCSFCFCSCCLFLVSVGFCSCCCFLRQLSARLPGRVPDKLCERSVICTQTHTHTHFDRCSSCNFV